MILQIRVSFFVVLVHSLASSASAGFTDFSDFTAYQTFSTNEGFSSQDIEFRAISLLPTGTDVQIRSEPSLGFADLSVGPGVEFVLPTSTQEVSFLYWSGGGRLAVVNGQELPISPENGLSIWDGLTVDGVEVSTNVSQQIVRPGFGVTSEHGIITFTGSINSFAIAGVELSIDDVSIVVPEPSTLLLIASSCPLLLRSRARQKGCPVLAMAAE